MASIRTYPLPKRYRDGGRVTADMVLEPDDVPEPVEAAPVPEPVPTDDPPPDDRGPLGRALDAQRQAEQLQRHRPSIRAQIAEVRESDPFRYRAAMFHYGQALAEGMPDDTPEMTAHVLAGIQAEMQYLHEQAAA